MRKNITVTIIAVIAVFTAFAFGCTAAPVAEEQTAQVQQTQETAADAVEKTEQTVQQDMQIEVMEESGQVIILEETAQKVVVFAPSALEIIDELGAMDKVIGVDNWSIDIGEPLAEGLEGYGDYQGLNMERLAQSMPDLIIALQGGPTEDYAKAEELGIIVYTVNAESIDRVYEEIKNIGILLGLGQEAELLSNNIKAEVEEIYSKVKDIPEDQRPRVFYQIFDDPLWSAGEDTFINDMIIKAGGINIVALDGLSQYVEYNVEKLIAHDPQVMIAGDGGMYVANTADVILGDPRFSSVSAVKEGRAYVVPENSVVRTSHHIIKGLKMFAKAIHPEIFGEFEIIE